MNGEEAGDRAMGGGRDVEMGEHGLPGGRRIGCTGKGRRGRGDGYAKEGHERKGKSLNGRLLNGEEGGGWHRQRRKLCWEGR